MLQEVLPIPLVERRPARAREARLDRIHDEQNTPLDREMGDVCFTSRLEAEAVLNSLVAEVDVRHRDEVADPRRRGGQVLRGRSGFRGRIIWMRDRGGRIRRRRRAAVSTHSDCAARVRHLSKAVVGCAYIATAKSAATTLSKRSLMSRLMNAGLQRLDPRSGRSHALRSTALHDAAQNSPAWGTLLRIARGSTCHTTRSRRDSTSRIKKRAGKANIS